MSPTPSESKRSRSPSRALCFWLTSICLAFVAAMATPLSIPAQTHPDDIYWDTRFDTLGTNSRVRAIFIDGSDVYVGGHFTRVGSVQTTGIARWDGTQWHALGAGVSGSVHAIRVHNDTVYVGGSFTSAGGVKTFGAAYWEGTTWHAMGGGVAPVTDIAAFKGSIYFAGRFEKAGGKVVNGIARWDGSDWQDLEGGLGEFYGYRGTASGLANDGEFLWVAGPFKAAGSVPDERFARWDGSTWHPSNMPNPIQIRGAIQSITVLDGDLYVGGCFTMATSSSLSGNNIVKWDGSQWHALHGGTDEMVLSVFGQGSNIYITGLFSHAGGVLVNHVAVWDGNSWSPLGSGLDRARWSGWEFAVAVSASGEVYAGGDHALAGGITSRHIGRWYDPVPAPSSGFPRHRSGGQDVAVRLSWGTSGRPGEGLMYDVYFGTTSPPPLLAADHPDTSFDPDSLDSETKYFWKIVAKDGNGDHAHGPVWNFTTEDFTTSRLVVSSVFRQCGLGMSDTVTIDLNIRDSAVAVRAAGVDVIYDPALLTFLSCEPGDLTTGWQQFDCADLGTSIRVGGFDLTPIPQGSYGVFARLTFLSNCCSQDSSSISALCAVNLTDDLAPLKPVCGAFQCEVSNARGDANGDGNVSSGDALCTFQAYLNLPAPLPTGCASDGWENRIDVDCSGAITPGDALCIFHNWLSRSCEFCSGSAVGSSATGGSAAAGFAAGTSASAATPLVTVPEILFDGLQVTVPVRLSGLPALEAFGFEVVYPKDQIEYVGLQWAAVSVAFEQVGSQKIAEGRLRVGGFATQPVDATDADIVAFRFRALSESVAGFIGINSFVDDLADAPTVNAKLDNGGDAPTFTRYTLRQNHPNPFNPSTTIQYEIPSRTASVHVSLTIHDVQGRLVRTLVNEMKTGGPHQVRWNGRNQDGGPVASGVYFYLLHAGGQRFARKLVLLK